MYTSLTVNDAKEKHSRDKNKSAWYVASLPEEQKNILRIKHLLRIIKPHFIYIHKLSNFIQTSYIFYAYIHTLCILHAYIHISYILYTYIIYALY